MLFFFKVSFKTNINTECLYINTGDWISHRTYAVLENGILELKKFIYRICDPEIHEKIWDEVGPI